MGMEKKYVWVAVIDCNLKGERIIEVEQVGYDTFEKAKEFLEKWIEKEKKETWIKNYTDDELEIDTNITEQCLWWECKSTDWECSTEISIDKIEIV